MSKKLTEEQRENLNMVISAIRDRAGRPLTRYTRARTQADLGLHAKSLNCCVLGVVDHIAHAPPGWKSFLSPNDLEDRFGIGLDQVGLLIQTNDGTQPSARNREVIRILEEIRDGRDVP